MATVRNDLPSTKLIADLANVAHTCRYVLGGVSGRSTKELKFLQGERVIATIDYTPATVHRFKGCPR